MKQNYTLLLTACVNPNKMAFTALQDREERLVQYITSVYYYYTHTNFPIILCNNSGDDFGDTFKNLKKDRFEYLFFDGNNYNRSLGKGYGEFNIIKTAVQRSRFINTDTIIIKITGRIIIPNLKHIINKTRKMSGFDNNTVLARISPDSPFAYSECIVGPSSFFKMLSCQENIINDTTGYYFEHLLFDTLIHSNTSYCPFTSPLRKVGVSGTTNTKYYNGHSEIITQLEEVIVFFTKQSVAKRGVDPICFIRYKYLIFLIHVKLKILKMIWAVKGEIKKILHY